MADVLQVMLYINLPENKLATTNIIDNSLATVVHVSRCAVNQIMQPLPGSMVFNIDMMVNILLISNLIAIGRRRQQQLVDKNLRRTNAKQINHNYSVGDMVKFVEYNPNKLDSRTHGPNRIVRVFTDRTVRIQLLGHVQEIVNIRKLFPYRQ